MRIKATHLLPRKECLRLPIAVQSILMLSIPTGPQPFPHLSKVPLGFNTSNSTPLVSVSDNLGLRVSETAKDKICENSTSTLLKSCNLILIRGINKNCYSSRSVGSSTEAQSKQNPFNSIMDRCILNIRQYLPYKVSK